jgi:hypothetical protein
MMFVAIEQEVDCSLSKSSHFKIYTGSYLIVRKNLSDI